MFKLINFSHRSLLENVILIGDVNPSTENRYLDEVIQAYNLINEPTY